MRRTAVVAWREFSEHRVFLVAAGAASAVSLLVPFIPGVFGWAPGEVRGVLTSFMALGFTVLSAFSLGASIVSGTAAQGRFGFFVARPLSAAAIWFGKIIGSLALITICELIVVVPAALSADGPAFLSDLVGHPWLWSGILIGGPLVLILLAHAASTAWRARTAWLGLDGGILIVVAVVCWLVLRPLLTAGAGRSAFEIVLAVVGSFAVAILVAGVVQVASGRVDIRRQHQALSLTMWSVVLVLVTGIAGYGRWLVTPDIQDLKWADGGPTISPSGEWIGLTGPTRGRSDVFGTFVLNLDSLSSARLGIGPRWHGTMVAFSGDGRRAAWTVREGDRWRLRYGTMESLAGGGEESTVLLEQQPWMALAHRGDRVATIEDGTLVVSSLPGGDVLGSVRLPAQRSHFGPYFASDNRIRIFSVEPAAGVDSPSSIRALEFDLDDRKMVEVGVLPGAGTVFSATIDDQRNRLLVGTHHERHTRWRYVDGRTLNDIEWAREMDLGPVASMLADGRLIRLVEETGSSRLEVLSPEGIPAGEVPLLQTAKRLAVGFQPTHSTLVVADSEDGSGLRWFDDWVARLVDLETGEIREIGGSMVPATWWYGHTGVTHPLPVGCAASRLLIGNGASLWRWDQATEKLELLVPGRAPGEN